MKRIAVIALVAAVVSACTFTVNGGKTVRCNGPVVDKMFDDLKDFQEIVINGSSDIKLMQGERFLVTVHANEEVYQHLNYFVQDGVLHLETIDNVTIVAEENEVTVALPVLKSITVNGAADADMNGYTYSEGLSIEVNGAGDMDFNFIQVPELSINVNGAGDIDLKSIEVDKLKVDVHGAGDILVSGKAGKAVFSVSGVGDIKAQDLDCDNIETHKSGMASIKTK